MRKLYINNYYWYLIELYFIFYKYTMADKFILQNDEGFFTTSRIIIFSFLSLIALLLGRDFYLIYNRLSLFSK